MSVTGPSEFRQSELLQLLCQLTLEAISCVTVLCVVEQRVDFQIDDQVPRFVTFCILVALSISPFNRSTSPYWLQKGSSRSIEIGVNQLVQL